MPIIAHMPPQAVTPGGGFDYVTVDAVNRRVYAAHGGAQSLLIVDADSGKILGQVKVGPMAGVAVNPDNGHVYTGNGDGKSISEVDPVAMKVVHTVAVAGPVDAIQYDASSHRIFGDEDDGTRVFVIDATTFKQVAEITVPGHKPEYLQIDPETHNVYQNIASDGEIAVIDPKTLKVSSTFKTPELQNNHPLQYDATHHVLLAAGENNVLAVYDRSGKLLHKVSYPGHVDQCDYDASRGWLACAGGGIALYSFDGTHAPVLAAQLAVAPGMHTVAIDKKTGTIWGVWPDRDTGKAYIQPFTYKP